MILPAAARVVKRRDTIKRMAVYVGTAGFQYKDWEGTVYPKELKKQKIHPLEFLAQYLDCCEINTSFYGHIQPQHGKNWCRFAASANPNFQFTAKMNRAFTHSPAAAVQSTSAETIRPLPEDEKLARAGLDSIVEENRLGALLAQFPISFKNTEENHQYLSSLIKKFNSYPLAVELRHASWNDPSIYSELRAEKVGFVNLDQPRLGRALEGTAHVTAPIGYVRLHGRNYNQWFEAEKCEDRYNYLYKPQELEKWKDKIEVISQKTEKTFVITNNHPKGKAVANALELRSMLSGLKVKAPKTILQQYWEVADFALP